MRHLNNGTDHRHSKSRCDQSSPARRTITDVHWMHFDSVRPLLYYAIHACEQRRQIIVVWSNFQQLQWRHNECDGVSNHRRLDCLPNRLLKRRSKKTSKLRVTGLCEGNPPVTSGFPHKGSVTRKKVSIWWRNHGWTWYVKFGVAVEIWEWISNLIPKFTGNVLIYACLDLS